VVSPSRADAPIGVLLFNLGGPSTLADVEPFLINLFSDRDIIELPLGALLQPIVARIIAKSRGPSVRENYRRIGGGSPQLRLTEDQARALEARLNRGGLHVRTFIAMRYWQPTTDQALEAMASAGISRVVTLTMFPHYSQATTGSSALFLLRAVPPAYAAAGATATAVRPRAGRRPASLASSRSALARRGRDSTASTSCLSSGSAGIDSSFVCFRRARP